MDWDLSFADVRAAAPRERRRVIARRLVADVASGRLVPGQRLPGTRALARAFGVHKNTILRVVDELVAQGVLETEPAKGTFVARALPAAAPPRARRRDDAPFLIRREPRPWPRPPPAGPGELSLAAGVPDPRLFPVTALARAWRRVAQRRGQRTLGYGDARGHPELIRALAHLVSSWRGVACDEGALLVTRGSQMALDLVARALLAPGDHVAVEALGYTPAWDALRLAGATLVPVPVDDDGLDTDALAALSRRVPIRAVYVTPHHQYPTMTTLPLARRRALLALARRHRFAVLEDDYDHEFHYDGAPVLPLAHDDDDGRVIMLGTLSKILAPGLRVGFVKAHPALIARLVELRTAVDRQGDLTMEAAIAELIDDGALQRHVRHVRGVYRARRDHLVALLSALLGDRVHVEVPRGGIGLWARAPGIDVDRWAAQTRARGVIIGPGSAYAFDRRPVDAVRLVFAALDESELQRAVEIAAACVPARGPRQTR